MLFRPSPESELVTLSMARGTSSQSDAAKAGLARGELTADLLPRSLLLNGLGTFASSTVLPGLRGGTPSLVDVSYVFAFSNGTTTECEDFHVSLAVSLVTTATPTSSLSSGVMGSKYEASDEVVAFEDTLPGNAMAIGDVKTEWSWDSELAGGRPSSRSLRRAATVASETSLGLMLRFLLI